MYAISNRQREELLKLLAALQALPGTDTKTSNVRRRAAILSRKLEQKKARSNGKTKEK